MYEAKVGKKAPYENVNLQGEHKASRGLADKFYGAMRAEEGMPTNPFNKPAPHSKRVEDFTQKDYGNLKAVYRDHGTAKVFGKGY